MDHLLYMVILQVTLWEALNKRRPDRPYANLQSEEEKMLQRWVAGVCG